MKKQFYVIAAMALISVVVGCGKKSTPVAPEPTGDLTPPVVTSSYPAGDTSGAVVRNHVITITFSEAMNQSSAQSAFSADGVPGSFYWQGNEMIFVPDTVFAANETVKVSITGNALDLADNGLSPAFSKWYRTLDSLDATAPTVWVYRPRPDSEDISIGTDVVVSASEALSDWSTNSIVLKDSAGFKINGNAALTPNAMTMQFVPSENLKYNTRYYVTIDTTLRDLCWNRLAAQYSWTFRTELDTVNPRVVSVSPEAGDTNVTVNTTITVCFSEPMDHTTTQTALSLTPAVAFSGYSWQGDTLMTATLAETLSFFRQYQVTISTGAQDLAGNGLATAYTLSFKTVRGIYACCSIAGEVHIFQQSDMKPEGKLVSYSKARQIKFSTDGNKAYLLCGGNPGQLHFLDVKNGNSNQGYLTVGNTPYDVAVSPYGNKLVVSITGDDRVLIINTETMGVIDTIQTGDAPTGIAFTPFNEIYVTLSQDTRLERYDLFTHSMDWVNIITGGEESLFSAANGRLFVTNGPYVTVITGSTFAALYNINNVSSRPFGLAVSPDGAHLAVSCYQENIVKIYNATATSEPAPLAQVTVGTGPKGLCYSPDGTKLYVSNSGSSNISVISRSGNTYTLSSTVTVGSGPWGIAVTP